MSDPTRPPMRRDALANRERIIDTAEIYFAKNGLDAPLQGLAAAAKVGTGTLYRNFASQDEVIRALYDRYLEFFDNLAARTSDIESGWEAIEMVLHECVHLLVTKGIVAEVMRRQAINDPDYRPSQRWVGPLRTLVERAVVEGTARPDLTVADLSAAAIVLGGVQAFAPQHQPWVSARLAALVLDGMRAHPHDPSPLPEPPEDFDERTSSIIKRMP